ncbi:MAG: hypothetical protein BGO14_03025 [Chlamydiales bacterium 38-26]|nr:SDR family oxidoreductase [Chlamydiales bacterium]OJV09315.1 MAG: hypothetical protein BGO14_03025 [Chlamydiales bacterium 38-26]
MKVCIIGCGYVGRAAALKWKAEGHEVTVTTRSLEKAYQLRPIADLVYILNDDWRELIKDQDVILLSVAPDNSSDYLQTYLGSAEMLVKALRPCHGQQIIYTGSTSIYGDHQGEWVDEQSKPKPHNSQAEILLATEKTLLKAAKDHKICLFRLGEIYGPGRSIANRVEKMQGKQIPGTGENYTNLVHLEEIMRAIDLAMKNSLQGVYNLCNDIHIKRKALYQSICEQNAWPFVQWNSCNTQTLHGGNKRVTNTKLKSVGWEPLNIQNW